ncbi:MAG: tetratricopeptide repeat protein [Acidobacteria bacterium]|nr:tetratricopeptide repeat protein [Acidobacteriota bacterium]
MQFLFQQFPKPAITAVCLNLITLTSIFPVFATPLKFSPAWKISVPGQSQTLELPIGKAVEFEASSTEPRIHTFQLGVNEYLELELQSNQKDVHIWLLEPGKEWDEITDTFVPEKNIHQIVLLSEATGPHQFKIAPATPNGQLQYTLKITEYRAATAEELHQIKAYQLIREGNQLTRLGTKEGTRQSLDKFEAAAEQYRLAGKLDSAAHLLNGIGNGYYTFGEMDTARTFYERSLAMARTINDSKLIGQATTNLALIFHVQGNPTKALEMYEQALVLRRTSQDVKGEGETLTNIAGVYLNQNQFATTLKYYDQALHCFQKAGFREGKAAIWHRMGVVYFKLGDYQKATDTHSQSLAMRRTLQQQMGIVESLNSLALVASQQGNIQKALDLFEEADQLNQQTGNARLQEEIYEGLGLLYLHVGELQQAEVLMRQALPLVRKIGDPVREVVLLINLANVFLQRQQFAEALEYATQALSLSRKFKDQAGEATALHNIAFAVDKLGKVDDACTYLEEALPLRRQAKDLMGELSTLNNLAKLYFDRGEKQKALETSKEVVNRWPQGVDPRNKALVLSQLARFYTETNQYDPAQTTIEEALKLVELIRSGVRKPTLRTSFFANNQGIYEFYIHLLMKRHAQNPKAGYDRVALHISERSRARSLLELLNEAGADIRQGGNLELLARERAVRQQLADKVDSLTRLMARQELTPETEASLQAEIAAITKEYQQLEDELRRTSPRYAALTQPKPLTVSEIQSTVVTPDTVLLEYSLGPQGSYVWVVTPDTLTTVELPQREKIQSAARKAYDLLSQTNSLKRILGREEDIQKKSAVELKRELDQAISELSHLILEPVASHLGNKRLLIVPDGVLHYIPFGVLTLTSPTSGKGKSEPLLANHELVMLPSASALDLLRKENLNRSTASKDLAVVADPVFEPTDDRIPKLPAKTKPTPPTTKKLTLSRKLLLEKTESSVQEVGLIDESKEIPRLPGTRREAESILKLVPKTQMTQAFDFAANRDFFNRSDLDQFRLLHIATHGFVNSEHPELSGLIFSMVDRQGNDQNGFLLLPDVFNLNLNADLVTLSACQSGLGKEIKGEGMVGLTQGFLYAGTSRVVVSLWSVSDQATAELMKYFYQGLLVEKLRPAEALRQAQLKLQQNKKWSSPYYWAAFQLTGEWK